MKRSWLPLLCCVTALTASASPESAPGRSLCSKEERVVFACRTGSKLLSICATKGLSPSSGYLFYRYGTSSRAELSFPQSEAHPSQVFAAYFGRWAKGNEVQLSFERGALTYTVFAYESALAGDGYGVAVYEGERLVSRRNCSRPVKHYLQELSDLGLRQAEKRDVP
jgi:hypothetical protein